MDNNDHLYYSFNAPREFNISRHIKEFTLEDKMLIVNNEKSMARPCLFRQLFVAAFNLLHIFLILDHTLFLVKSLLQNLIEENVKKLR